MPRGRASNYDDQREMILAKAAHLFAHGGYPGTSMNQVAVATGLSKATLYHYFRDKYSLLLDITEGHVSRLEALVVDVAAHQLPPEERMRALIARIMAEYAGAQDAHRVLTSDVRFLEPDDRKRVHAAWQKAVREGGELSIEYRVLRPDGDMRWICERTAAHRDGVVVTGFVGTVEDISAKKAAAEDRRRLESQMLHAQKLESLGVLAGGIAHDFNNLLVGILGNASVAREELPAGAPTAVLLGEIETAAHRAAELTTQLLAYAGKGRFNVLPLDVSEAVRETSSLLQSAISKRTTLTPLLDDHLPLIAADATQVRQVIMNLLTNASDALNDQDGEITLRTGTMYADEVWLAGCLAADGVQPGEFVFVEVIDTGVGMSAETLARIFDPFFTTKFTGRGLGLAATLGIVRGHRGALDVKSVPGSGSTFRVVFPANETREPSGRTPRSVVSVEASRSS